MLIVSLKAAALGLNLCAANHVILLDLWWNPSVEEQAIDRAHRIGQRRAVHVTRITIAGAGRPCCCSLHHCGSAPFRAWEQHTLPRWWDDQQPADRYMTLPNQALRERSHGSQHIKCRACMPEDFKRQGQVLALEVVGHASADLLQVLYACMYVEWWEGYAVLAVEADTPACLHADTVEDRILALQERKRALVEAALGDGAGGLQAAGRLTLADLQFLFRGA